jgi:hypothetical protein
MLAVPTIQLAMTMPSNPADSAIMTLGEVADYLNQGDRAKHLRAGGEQADPSP